MKRNLLGDLLVRRGALSHEQRRLALAQQRQWRMPLGQTVIALGYCDPDQVLAALSEQTGIPAVNLDHEVIEPALADLLPREDAERLRVSPLRRCGPAGQVLVVALAAPGSLAALDEVRRRTRMRISPVLADEHAIARAHQRLYACADAYAWPGGPLRPLREQMFDLDWAG